MSKAPQIKKPKFTSAFTHHVYIWKLVNDLTVNTFLLVFHHFCSRKLLPRKMISGNIRQWWSKITRIFMVLHLQTCIMVWQILRLHHWANQTGSEKDTYCRRAFNTQTQLETIVIEIEAMLTMTYMSSDLADPQIR